MILPIKHIADLKFICQRKHAQIEKYIIRKKLTIINYDYRVGYQVLLTNKSEYKCETPFKGTYKIFQTWTNGTVTLLMGAVTTRMNNRHINTYHREEI